MRVGKWKCAIELDENKLHATKYRENVWKNRGKNFDKDYRKKILPSSLEAWTP